MVYINPNQDVFQIINQANMIDQKHTKDKMALSKKLDTEKAKVAKQQAEVAKLKKEVKKAAAGGATSGASSSPSKIKMDPVFLALTRPAMLLGVTYSWFSVEGLIWVVYFINTSDFLTMIPGGAVTHAIGWYICAYEPRFMELFMIAAKSNYKCTNRLFHKNTASYDPY
jgi:type IV secretion system protein VirB3